VLRSLRAASFAERRHATEPAPMGEASARSNADGSDADGPMPMGPMAVQWALGGAGGPMGAGAGAAEPTPPGLPK